MRFLAQVCCQLGVDGVIRFQRRPDEVDDAVLLATERFHFVFGFCGEPALEQRVRVVVGAVRVDPARQRVGEVDRLERRSGLAVAVGGEVELRLVIALRLGHRLDVAVGGVDA